MKKKNILKIVIPSAIVLTATAIFCGAYYDRSYEECDNPYVIGRTNYCIHPVDQEYIEPTVTPGKYYFNGDINSCYMEVTENTWQIIPSETCDLETLYGLENQWSEEAPADPATAPDAEPDLTESRIQLKESIIRRYSKPHEYTVVTWHAFDITALCPGPGDDGSAFDVPLHYWEDGMGYFGPVLVNDKTIKCIAGEYILVE